MALLYRAKYPEPVRAMAGSSGTGMPDPPPSTSEEVFPENGAFTLSELQTLVGGMIEVSTFPGGMMMVYNENGKLLKLPVNVDATIQYRLYWADRSPLAARDTIVGDAVLCWPGEIK